MITVGDAAPFSVAALIQPVPLVQAACADPPLSENSTLVALW